MSLPVPAESRGRAAANASPFWRETERLLDRLRAGDRSALDPLLTQIHPVLYRWALANATDTDDADDIAQQALVAVYRKVGQFRGESPFAVWLYRLTTRTAAERRRTRARRRALDVRAEAHVTRRVYETDPGGRVDRDRLTALVRECYDRLPPQQRAALSLVDLEGYTPAEAAELMELAPGTLRANLFKARTSVRRQVFASSPALAERFTHVAETTPDASST
jgi:RNA polymerase sigma-70 factor (ECF subfamily)